FGLQDVALNRLINRALLDQTTADLGIAVSDSVVAGRIRSDPTFARGEVFDPVLFQQFLQFSLGMSEDAFVEELRADLARSYVESAIASGGRPPADLAEKLFAHRFEARSLDWLTVATAAMPDPGSPSPGDLEAFYQNNSARYARPVTRQVTWLHIDPNVLADRIIIPPDEIRAAYEAASGRYIQPEQRRLSQIVLSDEATAREVAARVAAGVSLADAAPDSAAPADLGWVGRGDLPTELSDAAFAGDAGSVAGPVESAFGWHVIQVNDVEPGRITPFEEAQAEIGRILAHDRAVEQAITMIEQVEDALAGGASLEQVATDIGLATDGLAAIDPDGRDGDGNPLDVPPVREFVAEVFAEQPGETSAALDTADGGFVVFRVGSETPATTRPLADVRTAVADAWRQRQRLAAASDLADTIVAAAAGGRSLSTLALE
ncbi:MAG: peptidyl-prolyl cis-trans isomerase, partial [Alphaproteobacteria bacterium]